MSLPQTGPASSPNSSKLVRVTRRRPCAVCGRASWCSYFDDGRGAVCMRVRSERATRDGKGWIHNFRAAGESPPRAAPDALTSAPTDECERADVERRHAAYSSLLSRLTLARSHLDGLTARGLPAEQISRLGYRSAPGEASATSAARSLSNSFDLRGVPGFYLEGGGWRLAKMPPGFIVPYRDERGRVEALQIRRSPHAGPGKYLWLSSKGKPLGSSSGSPAHFAGPDLLRAADEVLLTEGALKADVVAHLTRSPVVAAAGVSNFPADFAARLRESFPSLRRAIVAFDRDLFGKAEVMAALERLAAQLARAGLRVRVRTWPPPAKGYDDFLLSRLGSEGRAA